MYDWATMRLLSLWPRLIPLALLWYCIAGCGGDMAPPALAAEQRNTMKVNLTKLGARVTSETPHEIYVSLRNTHAEIRELGAMIEVELRTRSDYTDFYSANQAVAGSLCEPAELEEFNKWLRTAFAPNSPPVVKSEYGGFKVTLSRKPLRSVFTAKTPSERE
jgi:hypothetical protein